MLKVLAPAKINLTLHVTGKRPDGYHSLYSLVGFCDIADMIELAPAPAFRFQVAGPFARAFRASDLAHDATSTNLVVRAVHGLAAQLQIAPDVSVTLHKNLPLAAGIGGGSSDAAATIWGLSRLWQRPLPYSHIAPLLESLGSDVPVCYAASAALMTGRGEEITPVADMPEVPIVLVNPGQACPTATVFAEFCPPGSKPHPIPPEGFRQADDLLSYLVRQGRNDLEGPAQVVAPAITKLLTTMRAQKGCGLSRLAGSGATVFGLFEDEEEAGEAALAMQSAFPKAWVRQSWLNRFQRY